MEEMIVEIQHMVVEGKFKEIEDKVQQSIDAGCDLNELINQGLIAAMDVVGKKFSDGEIFVPEMLVSATTMKKGLELIKPLLSGDGNYSKGTILLGTVKGDLHDIGKNLVAMMFEGGGYKVVDMGTWPIPGNVVVSNAESPKISASSELTRSRISSTLISTPMSTTL